MLRSVLKFLFGGLFLTLTAPMALLSGFGRWEAPFVFFAQCLALIPGLPGDYLRVGYYRLTLESFSPSARIQFGSFFGHTQVIVAPKVYIGSYCELGRVALGERTHVASGVQIPSGRRQHGRNALGQLEGAEQGEFSRVRIGPDCWIGAGAIVMADLGAEVTIGAGAVVTKAMPDGVTAVGVPARPLPPQPL